MTVYEFDVAYRVVVGDESDEFDFAVEAVEVLGEHGVRCDEQTLVEMEADTSREFVAADGETVVVEKVFDEDAGEA